MFSGSTDEAALPLQTVWSSTNEYDGSPLKAHWLLLDDSLVIWRLRRSALNGNGAIGFRTSFMMHVSNEVEAVVKSQDHRPQLYGRRFERRVSHP